MRIKNNFLRILLKSAIVIVILSISIIIGFYYAVANGFFGKIYTEQELLSFENELASEVYSSDNILLGKYYNVNRTPVEYDKLPKHLINALVATEDVRFFEHSGVDIRSYIRVVIRTIIMGESNGGGGSTLTQQLVKNMYGRSNFGKISILVNKVKEIILSQRIEKVFNKDEILILYLNTVAFGENVYGIEAASQRYFNKQVSELNIEQSAVLVGILKANTYYNPHLYPQNSIRRRNVVLKQMSRVNFISQTAYDSLKTLPLELDYKNIQRSGIANYYLKIVRSKANKLIEEYNSAKGSEYNIEKDGLIINTTMNYQLQKNATLAYNEHISKQQQKLKAQYAKGKNYRYLQNLALKELKSKGQFNRKNEIVYQYIIDNGKLQLDSMTVLDSAKYSLTLLHAGMQAINPNNGAVLMWVGGRNFSTQPYDQIYAKRQMASTFKPFLYAQAFEEGAKPCDYIDNSELILSDFDDWKPENYDKSIGGKYSMAAALSHSKNIPTVRLWFAVEFENLRKLWNSLGFSSDLENEPAVSLGSSTASIYELTRAYASFANGGYSVNPYFIESIITKQGDTIYSHKQENDTIKLITAKTAFYINAVLQKAINEGTGISMRSRYNVQLPLAGKTGTSQKFIDAWFVAYNPSIVIAARVGANSPKIHFNNGANGSGGRSALPLVALTLQNTKRNKTLYKSINTKFTPINAEEYPADFMNCDDFKEDNAVDKVKHFLKGKKSNLKKEKKKAKRKKRWRDWGLSCKVCK